MSDRQDATQYENELSRLWNDLVSGEAKPGAYDLPAGDAQILSQFQQSVTRSQPDSARERAWRLTVARVESARLQDESNMVDIALPPVGDFRSRNGRTATRRWSAAPATGQIGSERRWGIVPLAVAAALLLLALGIGYVTFGPGWPGEDKRTTIPAAIEPAATPSPAPYTEESLLEITIPAALPVGETVGVRFGQYTVPPGFNETWVSADDGCCPEFRFTHVLVGDYTIRSEGTAQLLRGGADGTWETVAPDTAITLGPGDASFVSAETGGEGANLGSEPVELLHAVIRSGPDVAGSDPSDSLPVGWITHDGREGTQTFSAGPITLRLDRVELAPRSWYLLPQDGVFRSWLGYTEHAASTPVAVRVGWASGSAFNIGEETTILYVLTLAP